MSFKLVVLFALIGLALARPDGDHHSGSSEHGSYGDDGDDSYEFKYQVDEEDSYEREVKFGHEEKKSDGKVEGEYYVLLPNGLLQKVSYYVDGYSGFVAEVNYEGSEEEYSEEESESKEEYGRR